MKRVPAARTGPPQGGRSSPHNHRSIRPRLSVAPAGRSCFDAAPPAQRAHVLPQSVLQKIERWEWRRRALWFGVVVSQCAFGFTCSPPRERLGHPRHPPAKIDVCSGRKPPRRRGEPCGGVPGALEPSLTFTPSPSLPLPLPPSRWSLLPTSRRSSRSGPRSSSARSPTGSARST